MAWHLLSPATPMSFIPVLILAASTVAAAGAAPGPDLARGIAAYDRQEFTAALEIFKPIVYDVAVDRHAPFTEPYAWAAAYMAQMFRRGEGTAPDWPLACALFNDVWGYATQRGPGSVRPIPFLVDGIKEVCLPELQEEVRALRSACFLDGVTRREFVLDGGAWIVVDRRGFHLDLGSEHRDVGLPMRCHEVMIDLTLADVSVPIPSSDRRAHFLELFKWQNGIDEHDGHVVRDLHWIVFEVRGTGLGVATDQIVWTVNGGRYPSPEMPAGVRDATRLRLTTAGDVEWLVNVSPQKRGIIRKPQ